MNTGIQIEFNPAIHKYSEVGSNIPYTSITQLIDRYTPKFDVEYWSKRKAVELGLTQQEVKNMWAKTNKVALDKGTNTHNNIDTNIKESYITAAIIDARRKYVSKVAPLTGYEIDLQILSKGFLAKEYPTVFNRLVDKVNQGWKVLSEVRVWSSRFKIAGTIDLPLIKDTGEFIIEDWKTNKREIMFRAGYFKKVNGVESNIFVDKSEYMLTPISHLHKCYGTTYGLQLSGYAALLELIGMKCVGLNINHLRERRFSMDGGKTQQIQKFAQFHSIHYNKRDISTLFCDNVNKSLTLI